MKIERGRSLQARWKFLKQKGIHCEKEAGVGFGYLVLYPPAPGKWTRGFLLMNSLFHAEPEKHIIKA
jgi:hypothetical protein